MIRVLDIEESCAGDLKWGFQAKVESGSEEKGVDERKDEPRVAGRDVGGGLERLANTWGLEEGKNIR